MSKTVPRETLSGPKVRPILFRKFLTEASSLARKTATRRVLIEANSRVHPGTFAGVHWESGRVRANQPQAELRAQCRFDSGRVRVVSIFSDVRPGDVFWVKTGRFGSRKASKLTLEVKRVRVARLQDMTEAEAEAEGVVFAPAKLQRATKRETFAELWNAINGGGCWAANPWVWVYDYAGYNLNVDEYLAAIRGM